MEGKRDKAFAEAIGCLGPLRAAQLAACEEAAGAEELRLRAGYPPMVKTLKGERALPFAAVTAEELRDTLSRAAQYSVHSYAESLRNGYITLRGGHRIGLCGTIAEENGRIAGVRGIASINLRIARQVESLGRYVENWLGTEPPHSVLVLSPPGYGKTTLLREWVRQASLRGYTVGVADERSEIAALRDGVPQFDVGPCTDVLEGCGKQRAAMMLLRTMSPALLAFDEITAPEDVEAAALCAHCGTAVIASVHAACAADLKKRRLYRALLELGLFEQAVCITQQNGARQYHMERLEEIPCCD